MNLSEIALRKRKAIIFLLIVLSLGGIMAMSKIPVALFPNVNFPRIRVSVSSGNIPASSMSILVTRPVEQALRAVHGVKNIRSTTSQGATDIVLDFGWGQNMNVQLLKVTAAINRILPGLPPKTTFNAIRMYPTIYPVIAYSLTSKKESPVRLRDIALYGLKPLFLSVNGVSDVQVQGGRKREYRVTVNPDKLFAYGLNIEDVVKTISSSNIIKSVGKLDYDYRLYLVASNNELVKTKNIEKLIIKNPAGQMVRLGSIAKVSVNTVPQWTSVTADGKNAVIVQVIQNPEANTISISKAIDASLGRFIKEGKIPPDIKIKKWYDQSKLIGQSYGSLRDAIIIGIILAVVVAVAFLRSKKIMLVIITLLPSVLLTALLLLFAFGMSLNIMTLGGIAAAVGLVIDDIIVMIEYIIRHIENYNNISVSDNIKTASRSFLTPLLGSSLSTTIVFLPFIFVSGITGAFFKSLSLTIAVTLAVSFFITWLVVPIISLKIFKAGEYAERQGLFMKSVLRGYGKILRIFFQTPFLILVFIVLLITGGFFSYKSLSSGFLPVMDEGGFILDYITPPGTSLKETDRILEEVQNIIRKDPAVFTYTKRTGLQLGGGLTEPNTGDFFVRLKNFPRPPIREVMDRIRKKIKTEVPGIKIDMSQLMEDMIGDLVGSPKPVEIKIYSDNENLLYGTAPKVAALIKSVPGVIEVNDGVVYSGEGLNIKINRKEASYMGISTAEATREIHDYLYGNVSTGVIKSPKVIGVRVWTPRSYRSNINDIKNIQLYGRGGKIFPLERIASISVSQGHPEITHDNLKPMVAVSARIEGGNLGKVISAVKNKLDGSGIFGGKNIYYKLGGIYKQQQKAFSQLAVVLAAAIVIVFIVLLFLYEKVSLAIIILFGSILALSADFIGLFITRTQFNISSMMGLIITVGINTEMAIFYFSEYLGTPQNKSHLYSIIKAGRYRLRPILMSTLIAILALSPIALGIGGGSAMLQPLAIAIISGLTGQLFIVLVILPSMLGLSFSFKAKADGF